ncbi:glutamate ABC transporter substrate-binding protein [Williamsia deligens]|uniref:Glutamate ABC transporter substrate-binding protein n=1 Tax=Williamsia deligens TaxID=321325 RepID=A0ABW3GGG7_9NOCA|nr:glutamate ABC transporter substrate-binding protein [Williamsia deligens]MCP2195439.1 glutamate transport system substrate-binding protein [Williamsia deligens]
MRGTPRRRSLRAPLVVAVAIAVCAATLTACGNTNPRDLVGSIREGSVILGTKYDQPGLGLREPDKDFTGFDTLVSRYVVDSIARSMGVHSPKITWRETPSAQRETLIENGEVDMIAATYSINAARSKRVAFAGPYLVNYQGLLVRRDDTGITTLTDLDKGKKLCSVTGSTPAQNVKAQLPRVQLQEYDSYSGCVEALRQSKVDALTTDEVILAGFADFDIYRGDFRVVDMTYPKDACTTSSGKKVLRKKGTPFSTERYGIGMAKNYPKSVAAVNTALTAMLAPDSSGSSPWERALRESIGDTEVDKLMSRADRPDSPFTFTPKPGDLSFLDSTSTPCPAGLS